ncbi:hypothetical protein [Nonomuraea indica]|uniref:hypothetical protein n=1 Tax=Nonomuraea indica TaxID=1581193 RepID=UPI000C7A699B|nr:hypothetical protein [Nonomuraea indica]
MTNQHESFPDLMQEDTFEVVMRGYNRRQVHDYMMRTRNQIRDLEERLARAIEQAEQGRLELAEARRRMVEGPQSYEDLSPRLAQILKLGEEEAAAKREEAEAEAASVRDAARSEADRVLTSARETADNLLSSAQTEAERRVNEATAAAERMLAQAGADADEKLGSARQEAEDTLRGASAEAERLVTVAQQESERLREAANAEAAQTVAAARHEAETTLTAARERVAALDEHAGRRVEYLSNTHSEVVRRLAEIGSVLGDLMHAEKAAGPLVVESAVPPREIAGPEGATRPQAAPTQAAQGQAPGSVQEARALAAGEAGEPREAGEPTPDDDVRIIVADEHEPVTAPARREVSDDTDVNIGRLSEVRK